MGRPCPPTTQGDFRQTRAFSLRLPARSCRRGAPAATSTAAKHTPHRPHTHGPATKYRDIDRTYEKDVMFPIVCRCTPLGGTASMAHAYHTATALIDSRKSGVLALRVACRTSSLRTIGEAGGPALHLRTCTHTDSSADTPSTDIRTMYSSSKVSRAAPRWISISPARRRSRRRDRRES